MSLRALIILLVSGSLLVSLISIGVSYVLIDQQLVYILPYADGGETTLSLQMLLIQHSAIILAFSTLIISVSFFILSRSIVKPLRRMVAAIEGFMLRSERLTLADFNDSPAEIRKLAEVFNEFTIKVEEAHARDTEISRLKSDFISTAAHQFRTPLTGIRWALEALQKESLSGGQKALVQSALDKSHSLVSIVGTLLDISSIESGKYKYKFAYADLAELVAETVRDFGELAARSQVTLYFTPSEIALPQVRMDRERIKWVLNNIIENALHYTPAGGSVSITTEPSAHRVYVHVRDTGIGIQPQDRGNIFERFYRAGNAVAKENAGNGLGLYIARTIATDHGGDINFKSNENGPGTTFSLSLPVAG
ncbi:MAG TPA: HAMP domain-containing sensor histidine kinase [Candidatus Paceibacterota bacterium]|nr:HAMP domain-containing sensor histidine kinase [Candidatus Paceibacterota bacterium]